MKKILGIGNALVDIVTLIDDETILSKFDLPKGSMQLVDSIKSQLIKDGTRTFKRSFASGGSAANTIHGLSMLGIETGFIGSIGMDETGNFFENDFVSNGVKTFLYKRNTPTGTCVSLVTPDSERTMATNLGAAIDLNAVELKDENFRGFDILYMEGYLVINKELVIRACTLSRELGIKVALDLSSYNVVSDNLGTFKEIIEKYVDILFANEEEAKAFTGMEAEKALYHLSELCETVVVKIGAEGSLMKRGEEIIKVDALPVTPVDTTGAGDQYAAGFLYGIAKDEPLEHCGLYGAILAGKVIETSIARISPEIWPEIKKLISEVQTNI